MKTTALFLAVAAVVTAGRGHGADPDADADWRKMTTPLASLPGLSAQQVLRTILPSDVIPYSTVSDDAVASVAYRSAFKPQTRGMEHVYAYTDLFLRWIGPHHLVPPGIYYSFVIINFDPLSLILVQVSRLSLILTNSSLHELQLIAR